MRRRQFLLAVAALGATAGCTGRRPSADGPGADGGSGGGSNPSPTASPTPSPSPTPTASPTPEVSLGEIDEPALQEAVLAAVVEARGSSLIAEGSLAEKLETMATYHSEQMAQARTVAHVIDGETIDDRFERYDLSCRFLDDEGDSLLRHEDLEVVGSVSTRGTTVEGAAERLIQGWLDEPESSETLLLQHADYVGVGVTIVTGEAYVTLVYC